ncbi:hypothetical protein [Paenibacillus sp. UNC499MF]|uniref:hypothetical protein n=1 Tax=Paenibacillus sp. UNC499MF TaxID=1502751 RepID=UPI00089FC09B|nr:hypothetical protein [Paenibacillus sp. UNC499MF]SEF49233.1 hypothetical protein SAMN02799616_00222 [Paenibacillus sp. UNC499MF]
MKKIVILIFAVFFAFSANASAAYTAVSHDLYVSQAAPHKASVGLWSAKDEIVQLTVYSKSPNGQHSPVFSKTVTIGPAVPSPVELSVGYLAPGTYVIQGEFQGSYGSLGPVSLYPSF